MHSNQHTLIKVQQVQRSFQAICLGILIKPLCVVHDKGQCFLSHSQSGTGVEHDHIHAVELVLRQGV